MRLFRIIFLLSFVALIPAMSFAGVVGSPHDIAAQGYTRLDDKDKMKSSVCNYCHVPHKAKGARLWATTPPSLKGWGEVGPLCYSCHDGVAIVSPNVDASNTAFNPRSHGLKIDDLPDGDDVSKSGLPYTGGAASQDIECSTCHNPHDNTNRPFVRANINELCEKCHQRRENSGYGETNAESTHPVHKAPQDEVGDPSPIDVQEDFRVGFPREYPSEGGKDTPGVHWTLGGHMSGGGDGTMECVTCHSVHGKEQIGPQSDKLLSLDPVMEFSNEFCEGCHRGMRGDGLSQPSFPNPGGTEIARTYHPVDNDTGNGEGRIVPIAEPEGWVFGEGGTVLCTTCHKPHDALANSPILRPTVNSETFCESCHAENMFSHHPSGQSSGSGVSSGKDHATTREIVVPEDFLANGKTYGNPVGGTLYCSSCHRAHNAKCEPILVIECTEGGSCDICLNCHAKFNPTWQTDDNFKATHFMGDPMAAYIDTVDLTTGQTDQVNGQAGYYDQYPPLKKGAWPESNLESLYGGDFGQDITCCSCHSFGAGNITAGDADESPYTSADPTVAQGYIEGDLTSGLVARAGQYKEWLESDVVPENVGGNRGSVDKVDKYLCTGCHGLTPNTIPDAKGEGLTHPMMDANGAAFSPVGNIRFTYNKHMNCETCHSVHEADSRGGFYILKDVELRLSNVSSSGQGTVNPYVIRKRDEIEYAPLCHRCHIDY